MNPKRAHRPRARTQREGLLLLLGIVALMWLVEVINCDRPTTASTTMGSYRAVSVTCGQSSPRRSSTANFSPHLVDNTIPLVFMGVIIALRGAARLAAVTLIVVLVGGLGTWLIAPLGTRSRSAPAESCSGMRRTCSRGACSTAARSRFSRARRRRGVGRGARRPASFRKPASPGRPTCAARSVAWWRRGCCAVTARRRWRARVRRRPR